MSTIPASQIVNVTPSVLAAGGSALELLGLLLTDDDRVPIGSVQSFASAAAISAFFGPTSQMADLGQIYFNGFENSSQKPGSMLAAQYPRNDVGAWLRGGNIGNMTLAELQALSGTLAIVIDGVLKSASINLAAATSFSSAASIIGSTLAITGPQVGAITASIAGGTMTVTAVASGTLGVGQVLSGTGVTANTYISGLLSGTGGTGTYSVSPSQNMSSSAVTVYDQPVSYDSVSEAFVVISPTVGAASSMAYGSGALATDLLLTALTGATLSQGADAADPEAFMDALVLQTKNWATFTTTFDPDASGDDNKLLFTEWTNAQNKAFAYVGWDTSVTPTTTNPAPTSYGAVVADAEYNGTIVLWVPDAETGAEKATFVCSIGACLDFEQLNGRATYAFRRQSGLVADVTDGDVAENLIANGYNFYGVYGSRADEFSFIYPGTISGAFLWADSYINQIQMNDSFVVALMNLLQNAFSVPYNAAGRAQIEASLADPINAALNFGTIRAGITLSASQIAAVNSQAGAQISGTLQTRGWYLQVLEASAAVRQARGSPPCTFWYTDGQSVQKIDLLSIEVQ